MAGLPTVRPFFIEVLKWVKLFGAIFPLLNNISVVCRIYIYTYGQNFLKRNRGPQRFIFGFFGGKKCVVRGLFIRHF